MKTISQIAAEIGVTKQAVHKKIKQEPLASNLSKFMTINGNTIVVDVNGEKLIKQAFPRSEPTTLPKANDRNMASTLINSLQKQIQDLTLQNQDLRKQLEQERTHSRAQADRITDLAAEMAHLADNAQKLHAGDMVPRIASKDKTRKANFDPAKQGIFDRIFQKREK